MALGLIDFSGKHGRQARRQLKKPLAQCCSPLGIGGTNVNRPNQIAKLLLQLQLGQLGLGRFSARTSSKVAVLSGWRTGAIAF